MRSPNDVRGAGRRLGCVTTSNFGIGGTSILGGGGGRGSGGLSSDPPGGMNSCCAEALPANNANTIAPITIDGRFIEDMLGWHGRTATPHGF